MDTGTPNKKIIIAFILGIFIGAGSMWVWLSKSEQPANTQVSKRDTLEKDVAIPVSKNNIAVNDQRAGLEVLLASFELERDGWVAIHEDANGEPGNILGARRFDAGTYNNESLELLRATEPNATYYAMLHEEDGDRAFNIRNDVPLLGLDGRPIMNAFTTLP